MVRGSGRPRGVGSGGEVLASKLESSQAQVFLATLCHHWSRAGEAADAIERAITCHLIAADQVIMWIVAREGAGRGAEA